MLDKTDYKILYNLHYDARIPLSKLAKKVGISKQNLNYRIKKLVEREVILGFISVIDSHRLGYLTYRTYFRFKSVDEKREKEILDYFKNNESVLWLVSISGPWDLEVVFTAKSFINFNNILKKVKEDLGQYFSKYDVSMSIVNHHLDRDYLVQAKRKSFTPNYYGFEPKEEKLDELDINILLHLSTNCRQSNQELGRKLGVTYHTIKQRIEKLEKKKIIQSHRILLNLDMVGRKHYKAALILNNPKKEDEERLYSFCSKYNFVTYLVEVLGKWQLDIEVEVEGQEEIDSLLRAVRNEFPDLVLDYEIFQVTKEHKLNYLPMARSLKVA